MYFDTFKHIRKMNEAGFSEEQSEAVVSTMGDLVKDQFVTKQDLREALMNERLETSKEFNIVKKEFSEIKIGMESLEKRMLIRLGSMQILTIGLLVSLKFF